MFNPAPHQPLSIFFELTLAGLSQIYYYPNIPIEFEVVFTAAEGGFGTVSFTLFDEAGWEVEPSLWQSMNTDTGIIEGKLKWGYTQPEGIESGEYTFMVQDYTPRYRDNAFYLTVIGYITSMTPLHSSNSYSGTLEECLQKLADDHGLTLQIDPPLGPDHMMESGISNTDTTEKREMKHYKKMSESDMRFVNRMLYFARDQEGKIGYRPIVTEINGQKTLLITKAKKGKSDYQYKVQDKDGVVIDWNPNVQFAAIFDQCNTQVNGHALHTGEPTKQLLDPAVSRDLSSGIGEAAMQLTKSMPPHEVQEGADNMYHTCPEIMPDDVVSGAIRSRNAPARTPYSSSIPALYSHLSNLSVMSTAELEVAGDPRIVAHSPNNGIALVDVDFRTPINYFNTDIRDMHYTSGIWMVEQVVHKLSVGQYTTTYSMFRPGQEDEPQEGSTNTAGGSKPSSPAPAAASSDPGLPPGV